MNIIINPFRLPELSLSQARQVQQSLQALRIGQLLDAVVSGYTRDNYVQLKINGQSIQAKTDLPLTVGERLQLQVADLKEAITLKIMQRDHNQAVIQQTVRQALPVQAQYSPLLANLQFLKQVDGQQLLQQLPKQAQQLLQQLSAAIPPLKNLQTTPAVIQAFKNSGVFLENQLLTNSAQANHIKQTDIKALLSQLLRIFEQQLPNKPSPATAITGTGKLLPPPSLTYSHPQSLQHAGQTAIQNNASIANPQSTTFYSQQPQSTQIPFKGSVPTPQGKTAPSISTINQIDTLVQEITHQLKSVLARVQLHQVASVQTDLQPQPSWLIEVPFQHQDEFSTLQVLIEREQQSDVNEQESSIWSVTFAMEFDRLGALQAKVSLLSESVKVEFWLDQEKTWQQLNEQLPQLESMLHNKGLQVNQLALHHGLIENLPLAPDNNLLDLEI